MKLNWFGLSGWRWLLILEGLPAVVLGLFTLRYLTDWPKDARWLPDDERNWLTEELARQTKAKKQVDPISIWQALRNREVVLLTLIYFFVVTGNYGFIIWLPKILQSLSGLSTFDVTLVAAIPFMVGALPAMLLVGWHSDRTGERRCHTAVPMFAAAVFLALSQWAGNNVVLAIAMLTLAAMGLFGYLPSFWALPSAFLSETAAAACIGVINSVGNLGGFAGPYAVGYLNDRTGTYVAGISYLVGSILFAGLLVLLLKRAKQPTLPHGAEVLADLENH
jgi:sugar phosphate permease